MPEQRTLSAILLENKLVSAEQLKQISAYSQAVGIELYEAVLQKKIAPQESVMMAYAESIRLPYIPLSEITIDESLVTKIDPFMARQHSFIPISLDQGFVQLATTKPIIPDVEEELRMIFNLPVRCAICTPAVLNEMITAYFPRGTSPVDKSSRSKSVPFTLPKETQKIEPMSDEEKKNRLMLSCVAFNFSVFLVCVILYSLQFPPGIHNSWVQFPVLGVIGIVVGAGVFYFTWTKLSR